MCKLCLCNRIITTTHKINVFEACHSFGDAKIYKMKPLSDDDSRSSYTQRYLLMGTNILMN
uniref:Uncharacterized protein n=1 Tax=Oryza punctata TaxID=4537 RepID=A0A0E0MIB6_ORYPU